MLTSSLFVVLLLSSCSHTPSSPATPDLTFSVERVLRQEGKLSRVALSPDGQYVTAASSVPNVTVWRVNDGSVMRVLPHPLGTTAVAFSPDGKLIATTAYDSLVRIWRVADGVLVRTLHGHSDVPWSLAFSPDGNTLATGSADKSIILWNVADGSLIRKLTGHALNVWSLSFSRDGKWLASGSFDHSIRIWRVDTGAPVRLIEKAHQQAVVGLAFSPDGQWLASSGDDAKVRLWHMPDVTLARTLDFSPHHVYTVAFTPDSKYVAGGGRDHGSAGELIQNFFAAAGGTGDTVRVWRVSDGAVIQTLAGQKNDVYGVAFSNDGRRMVTSSEDKTVVVWRMLRR